MTNKVKNMINLTLAAVALAMGGAVIALSIIDKNVATNDLIKMLAVAIVSLGFYALKIRREKKIE